MLLLFVVLFVKLQVQQLTKPKAAVRIDKQTYKPT